MSYILHRFVHLQQFFFVKFNKSLYHRIDEKFGRFPISKILGLSRIKRALKKVLKCDVGMVCWWSGTYQKEQWNDFFFIFTKKVKWPYYAFTKKVKWPYYAFCAIATKLVLLLKLWFLWLSYILTFDSPCCLLFVLSADRFLKGPLHPFSLAHIFIHLFT
jgi:hypothetical protein